MQVLYCAFLVSVYNFLYAQGTMFQRSWGFTGTSNEECYSAIQSTDGGYVLFGYTTYSGSGDLIILKVSSDGNSFNWANTYGSGVVDKTSASGKISFFMDQANDGGYIMTGMFGRNFFSYPGQEMLLIKATSSGGPDWERQFGSTVDISGSGDYPTDAGFCVKKTTDGGYILAGYVEGGTAGSGIYGHDGVLAKFNTAGVLQWNVRFGTSGSGNEDHAVYVSQTTDGGYIVGGSTSSGASGNWDLYLVKLTSSGGTSWARRIHTTSWDEGYFVHQTPDGNYIMLASSGSTVKPHLVKIANNGTSNLWGISYTISGMTNVYPTDMTITNDGGFAITGYGTVSGSNTDVFLIKTNSIGTVQWSYRYGGSRAENGNSIKQTSDGGFVIGGTSSSPSNGTQFYLIKTDSNGSSGECESVVSTTTTTVSFGNAAATLNTTPPTEGVTSTSSSRISRSSSLFRALDCNYNFTPITLLTFTGVYSQNVIKLYWATASEENNSHFVIERMSTSPEKNWEEAGIVQGAGNSSIIRNYEFIDHFPLSSSVRGINGEEIYYRLKQVDYDGKYEYFGPIAIKLQPSEGITIHTTISNDQLLIIFGDDIKSENCLLRIYDINGKICHSSSFIPSKFKRETWIDASQWSKGVYYVSAIAGDKRFGKKFLKQ